MVHIHTLRNAHTHQIKSINNFKKDLFIYYVYSVLPACMSTRLKRAPDLITDGCEPPRGCWELNSGPPEEQSVLLTPEPSLLPCTFLEGNVLGYKGIFLKCLQARYNFPNFELRKTLRNMKKMYILYFSYV